MMKLSPHPSSRLLWRWRRPVAGATLFLFITTSTAWAAPDHATLKTEAAPETPVVEAGLEDALRAGAQQVARVLGLGAGLEEDDAVRFLVVGRADGIKDGITGLITRLGTWASEADRDTLVFGADTPQQGRELLRFGPVDVVIMDLDVAAPEDFDDALRWVEELNTPGQPTSPSIVLIPSSPDNGDRATQLADVVQRGQAEILKTDAAAGPALEDAVHRLYDAVEDARLQALLADEVPTLLDDESAAGLEEANFQASLADYRGAVVVTGKIGGTEAAFQAAVPAGLWGVRASIKTGKADPAAVVLGRIMDGIAQVIDQYGPESVMRVTFSAPGPLHPDDTGTLTEDQVNLPFPEGFSYARAVQDALAKRYGRRIPVTVKHDGTAGNEGERSRFGTREGATNLLFVIAGTGVRTRYVDRHGHPFFGGAAIGYAHNEGPHHLVFNGAPAHPDYRYVALETQGRFATRHPTYYGKQDLEHRTSGPAIADYAQALIAAPGQFGLTEGDVEWLKAFAPDGDLTQLTPRELGEAANAGNRLALKAIQERAHELGIGLAVLLYHSVQSYGAQGFEWPDDIIIGSGVAQIGPLFLQAVQAGFRARLTAYGLPDVEHLVARIELSRIKDDTARELLSGLPTEQEVEQYLAGVSIATGSAGLEEQGDEAAVSGDALERALQPLTPEEAARLSGMVAPDLAKIRAVLEVPLRDVQPRFHQALEEAWPALGLKIYAWLTYNEWTPGKEVVQRAVFRVLAPLQTAVARYRELNGYLTMGHADRAGPAWAVSVGPAELAQQMALTAVARVEAVLLLRITPPVPAAQLPEVLVHELRRLAMEERRAGRYDLRFIVHSPQYTAVLRVGTVWPLDEESTVLARWRSLLEKDLQEMGVLRDPGSRWTLVRQGPVVMTTNHIGREELRGFGVDLIPAPTAGLEEEVIVLTPSTTLIGMEDPPAIAGLMLAEAGRDALTPGQMLVQPSDTGLTILVRAETWSPGDVPTRVAAHPAVRSLVPQGLVRIFPLPDTLSGTRKVLQNGVRPSAIVFDAQLVTPESLDQWRPEKVQLVPTLVWRPDNNMIEDAATGSRTMEFQDFLRLIRIAQRLEIPVLILQKATYLTIGQDRYLLVQA